MLASGATVQVPGTCYTSARRWSRALFIDQVHSKKDARVIGHDMASCGLTKGCQFSLGCRFGRCIIVVITPAEHTRSTLTNKNIIARVHQRGSERTQSSTVTPLACPNAPARVYATSCSGACFPIIHCSFDNSADLQRFSSR